MSSMDIEEVTADIDDLDLSDDDDDVKDTAMAPAEMSEIEKYIAANREKTLQSLAQNWRCNEHDKWCEAAKWIVYNAVQARESNTIPSVVRFRGKNGEWIAAEALPFGIEATFTKTATLAEVQEMAQKIVLAMKETIQLLDSDPTPGFRCVMFKCESAVNSYIYHFIGSVKIEIVFCIARLPIGQI